MKLVSWNLNGLEDRELDVRTESAMFQLLLGAPIEEAVLLGFKPNSPDIVVLQEVVERSFYAHVKPHLEAAGFVLYPTEPTESSYFEVIAVKAKVLESSFTKFPWSDQGRGVSVVKVDGLTILTSHMESMKPGAKQRIDQGQFIIDLMENSGPCIFAGDTNLRKAEWAAINQGYVDDAWEYTGSIKKYVTSRHGRQGITKHVMTGFGCMVCQ
ncbi:MAG: endonuclease/exonuclease/phosphatase family protein [Leucothrix sp.]